MTRLAKAGTRASVTGRSVRLQTPDLQRTLTALLQWANSRDLVLGALEARSTSLEEAFHAVAASGSETDQRAQQRTESGGMNAAIMTVSSSARNSSRQSVHRFAALARAEGVLLRRNRIALLTGVALPAALVVWLRSSGLDAGGPRGMAAAMLVTWLAAFALLAAVYYNLVTAIVARREELVFKRLALPATMLLLCQ